MRISLLIGASAMILAGCGSGAHPPSCKPDGFAMIVRPSNPKAAPDHTLPPPGNQELFVAGVGSEIGPGCAGTNVYKLTDAYWTSSDPKAVSISSAQDTTNGLATCLESTGGGTTVSGTLTAYGFTQTLASSITCK